MTIIKFRDGSDWFKANWVFRQLAEDTITTFPNDPALKLILEKAGAFGALFLNSMEAEVAICTEQAIRKAAEATISGAIGGWRRRKPEDADGQRMYIEAITELLELLKKQIH